MSAKAKLNSAEILISNALFDLNISHNEFVSVSNVLKPYDNNHMIILIVNKSFSCCKRSIRLAPVEYSSENIQNIRNIHKF